MSIEAIKTLKAPPAVGPYSQAVVAHPFLFISGQIPLNLKTKTIDALSIEDQTKLVLSHVEAILIEAGLSRKDVVRVEIYLKDLTDFTTVNKLYGDFFTEEPLPARQTMQVAKLPLDSKIEISCVAYYGN